MTLKTAIQKAYLILKSPESEFIKLEKRTFEKVLEDFAKLLLFSGFLAGVANLLVFLINAVYLQMFKGVSIEYLRLINYSLGVSVSTFFFYIFAGSILLFILAMIIKYAFYKWTKDMKLTYLLSIIFYASSPILLFGWVSSKLAFALFIWTAVIIIIGISVKNKPKNTIKKKK